MNLKTLKDLPKRKIDLWSAGQIGSTDKPLGVDYEIYESTLKKEAINWIKELTQEPEQEISFCLDCHKEVKEYVGQPCENHNLLIVSDIYEPEGPAEAVKWIKHFFNISEEDLKMKSAKCDRCGKESNTRWNWLGFAGSPKEWAEVCDKDLCPACNTAWDKVCEKAFKEFMKNEKLS